MEDLLQKHNLVEADISAQAERIRAVQATANRFTSDEMRECCSSLDSSLFPLFFTFITFPFS